MKKKKKKERKRNSKENADVRLCRSNCERHRLLQVVKAFLGQTVISDRAVKRFYSLHRGKFKQRSTLEINDI